MSARIEEDEEGTHAPSTDTPASPFGRVVAVWPGGHASLALPEEGLITIGRSRDASLALAHTSVSRRHAQIHVGPALEIEDLGGSNGVRLDGVKLARGAKAVVGPGSVVELGDVTLFVQMPISTSQAASDLVDATAATPATSTPMDRLHATIELVAKSAITVLLVGETGVGKGIIANEIHQKSPRRAAPLIPINCGALAESLLETELFGHEKGAFTGATATRPGLIESADGGTILLDEIGEMPPSTQVKILRVIENREVLRVGGRKPFRVDVRFLAATHRDLEAMVAAGSFREDLYFRLNGISLVIPPLRERSGEIVPLAERFLAEIDPKARLSSEARAELGRHAWPGNIRELRNVIERAALLAGDGPIRNEHLRLKASPPRPLAERAAATSQGTAPAGARPGKDDERRRIEDALDAFAGNQTRAAEALGMSRRTFLRKLEEYNFPRPRLK